MVYEIKPVHWISLEELKRSVKMISMNIKVELTVKL